MRQAIKNFVNFFSATAVTKRRGFAEIPIKRGFAALGGVQKNFLFFFVTPLRAKPKCGIIRAVFEHPKGFRTSCLGPRAKARASKPRAMVTGVTEEVKAWKV